jgi:hypothetical protein
MPNSAEDWSKQANLYDTGLRTYSNWYGTPTCCIKASLPVLQPPSVLLHGHGGLGGAVAAAATQDHHRLQQQQQQ